MSLVRATAVVAVLVAMLAAASHRLVSFPPLAARGLVVVTGASTGIGAAAAQRLARAHPGWTVLAGVRKAADAAAVSALGVANLRPLTLDVASEASRAAAVAEVLGLAERTAQPLLALVNNAGVSRGAPVEFHDLADARAVEPTLSVNTIVVSTRSASASRVIRPVPAAGPSAPTSRTSCQSGSYWGLTLI